MSKGYVHVYTGNGKGKTTAAFGVAIRAAMSGLNVYIGQFVKDMKYSETEVSNIVSGIRIEQLGNGCFINSPPSESDKLAALAALKKCDRILSSGEFDLVILDEIHIAFYFKLLEVHDVIEVLKRRAENVEVITTGRYAPDALIEFADLVTEMKEVKHYYSQGVLSRKGIDC